MSFTMHSLNIITPIIRGFTFEYSRCKPIAYIFNHFNSIILSIYVFINGIKLILINNFMIFIISTLLVILLLDLLMILFLYLLILPTFSIYDGIKKCVNNNSNNSYLFSLLSSSNYLFCALQVFNICNLISGLGSLLSIVNLSIFVIRYIHVIYLSNFSYIIYSNLYFLVILIIDIFGLLLLVCIVVYSDYIFIMILYGIWSIYLYMSSIILTSLINTIHSSISIIVVTLLSSFSSYSIINNILHLLSLLSISKFIFINIILLVNYSLLLIDISILSFLCIINSILWYLFWLFHSIFSCLIRFILIFLVIILIIYGLVFGLLLIPLSLFLIIIYFSHSFIPLTITNYIHYLPVSGHLLLLGARTTCNTCGLLPYITKFTICPRTPMVLHPFKHGFTSLHSSPFIRSFIYAFKDYGPYLSHSLPFLLTLLSSFGLYALDTGWIKDVREIGVYVFGHYDPPSHFLHFDLVLWSRYRRLSVISMTSYHVICVVVTLSIDALRSLRYFFFITSFIPMVIHSSIHQSYLQSLQALFQGFLVASSAHLPSIR